MNASISVAIVGLAWFSTYVSAQPNKDLYELQERCGKRAAKVFEREYGSGKDGQTLFNYENHYSARLKKCFFLEIAISYEREEEKAWLQNYETVRYQREQAVRDLCKRSY